MRHFISTAHYSHQHFGCFTPSIDEANNANQQSNQINRKSNDLVQKISRQDILKLLDKLDVQSANGIQSNHVKLDTMPIPNLKQRFQELGAVTNGRKQIYRNDYSTC